MSGLPLTMAAEIAAALEGRREGRQWRCRCLIHGGRSLLVRDGEAGRILVFCHGGCEPRDVLAVLRARGLLDERRDTARPRRRTPKPLPLSPDDPAPDPKAVTIWHSAEPVTGTVRGWCEKIAEDVGRHTDAAKAFDRQRQSPPRLGRDLSREDARQIAENVTGFFAVLAEWSRAETPTPANDTNKPTLSDTGDVRREKKAGGGWAAGCPVHDDGDGGWE